MKYKPYVFALAIVVLLACIVYVLIMKPAEPMVKVTPAEAEKLTKATVIKYQDSEGAELTVAYAGDLVQVSGLGYNEATLRQTPAASGVKYMADDGLVFHSKGDEVILETPQARLFLGREVGSEEIVEIPTPDNPPVTDTVPATTTATSSPLLVGKWQFESGTNDGEAITLAKPEEYALTFAADGTVAGDTDCNGFGGTYTVEADTLTLSDFMSTLMFCEGSSEQVFTDLLSRQAFTIDSLTDTVLRLTADNIELQFSR
ncbi:MAG: hypothetical protein RLZZ70_448 [Candidatus Parcubacteria bacterium]|jgi:heat shock protein HslJ/membrane-bound inhibitor of C-type lysozyme